MSTARGTFWPSYSSTSDSDRRFCHHHASRSTQSVLPSLIGQLPTAVPARHAASLCSRRGKLCWGGERPDWLDMPWQRVCVPSLPLGRDVLSRYDCAIPGEMAVTPLLGVDITRWFVHVSWTATIKSGSLYACACLTLIGAPLIYASLTYGSACGLFSGLPYYSGELGIFPPLTSVRGM
jgi:hypothetical protein